ncbi:MAG: tRNA (adenosine(37)-N6)-threonylcarbamoyltransferase complex dimerization subunit type 1 TsaB [Bacteroidales bacterium]|nr:tRNA (adenosine(37)-N6)-threonylcarbamoyltransferase complex dimerization subunit type 1 TsaB [Bacteroidales bacterium]
MPKILLIDTSTALCSVALSVDGGVVASRASSEPRAHAAMTAPFVAEVLSETGLYAPDLDAVCVSAGPGSYTGLRVGVSTAKGICFAAGIPLLSVGTLEALVYQARAERQLPSGCRYVLPMIDARRMEVYTAVYTPEGQRLSEVEPRIIDAQSFAKERAEGPVLVIGDGADKCREALAGADVHFVQVCPHAASLTVPAEREFAAGHFQDTAYFEPFYLKDFVATVSRKKLF